MTLLIPGLRFLRTLRILVLGCPADRTRLLFRTLISAANHGNRRLAAWASARLQGRGLYISPKAKLAATIKQPHPTGIVIGDGVIVADDVVIYQSVTLGGRRRGDWQAGRYPSVGANTVIFAGAVLAGNVRIGRGCTIGANAVVISDVPDGATAVGVPARIILGELAV